MNLRAWFVFIGLFLLLSSGALSQDARFIRFRNETISPLPYPLSSLAKPWLTVSLLASTIYLGGFIAGTYPKNNDSFLRLDLPSGQANRPVSAAWTSVLGRDYPLEISAGLLLWSSGGAPIRGIVGPLTSPFPVPLGRGTYYFWVRVIR